ncbi:hypothetical protein BU17DRAFT_101143 [Hysterangium stoloniferum]|nr:hypothetical protein BU17DRAFT_101143 [Hysterangium stoloniferum]
MSSLSKAAASALIKQNVTYLDIVAAAVLMYDYLLTVEREARLVWPVPWNVGKILFFLTRYPVFADTFMVLYHQFAILSAEECQTLYRTIGFLLGVGTLISETILALRTWVIWHRDHRIGIFLAVTLAGLWVPVFYFLKVALYSLVFVSPPGPNLPGCFLDKQNPILWLVFIFVMTFETIVLALTLVKGVQHFRGESTTLISVLYRDGIMNYIYLCLLSVINVVVLLTAPHGYSTLLTATQRALHSILSARILLHLREAAVSRVHHRSTTTTPSSQRESSMGGFTVGRSKWSSPDATRMGSVSYVKDGLVSQAHHDTQHELGPEDMFAGPHEALLPDTVTWFGEEGEIEKEHVPLVGVAP